MKVHSSSSSSSNVLSRARWIIFLCASSFIVGMLFASRMWRSLPEETMNAPSSSRARFQLAPVHVKCHDQLEVASADKSSSSEEVFDEVSKTHKAIRSLDKTISLLEMELAVARAAQSSSSPTIGPPAGSEAKQKVFVVIGINTAFSSQKRRQSLRETWMPRGEKLKQLKDRKGIVIRFIIGHRFGALSSSIIPCCFYLKKLCSATPGGPLDRVIEQEDAEHGDFLRLDHVEGYDELTSKTKVYFATAVAKWDADFYVKVDDDVHVNIGMLVLSLARYRYRPRVYIGCMKSGPVLYQRGVKYREPEHWKFGEQGNKYFRHATGQIYAISKDLATYVSMNRPILHNYANEDVSLGSWFLGLDVEHVDERSFCCGTPPDCEWKAQAGSICVASFDWVCSGVCKPVQRLDFVHQCCGEDGEAVWNVAI